MGLVDILWGLDLLAGRAEAVGADFILAGPVSLWLKGITPPPKTPRFILITSKFSVENLLRALSYGSRLLEWGPEWADIGGRAARLSLRGLLVEVLVDPIIDGIAYEASRLARESSFIVLGNHILRLAPIWFELKLSEALEHGEHSQKEETNPRGNAKSENST
ncbi:MAG: hypothetical protein LRS46_02840 [Desulfurococcales archaeon]|nr:hypothetical protein [Desulfurococcales archaeon]